MYVDVSISIYNSPPWLLRARAGLRTNSSVMTPHLCCGCPVCTWPLHGAYVTPHFFPPAPHLFAPTFFVLAPLPPLLPGSYLISATNPSVLPSLALGGPNVKASPVQQPQSRAPRDHGPPFRWPCSLHPFCGGQVAYKSIYLFVCLFI